MGVKFAENTRFLHFLAIFEYFSKKIKLYIIFSDGGSEILRPAFNRIKILEFLAL